MKDQREFRALKEIWATPGLRSLRAILSPRHWRMRGATLVLFLLLISQAHWTAAQNEPPAGPTAFSPVEQITDQVLFEDLKDSAKRLYLPRYRLAVQTVSGNPQYRVRFFKQGTGWSLEVYLEKYPAAELGDAVRTAQELSHQTRALLRYDLLTKAQNNQANAYEELAFQEVTLERGGLRAVLHLEDLRERDAVIHALEDAKFDATLLVQRMLTVQYRPEKEIGELSAALEELGRKRFSWAHAGRAGVSIPPGDWKKLEAEEAVLNARIQKLRTVGIPAQVTLDNKVPSRPFAFDRTLHPYVFAGIIPNPGSKPQLVRSQLSWQNQYYSYFRPADQTDHWYYLPDRFVLAEDNRMPRLLARFTGLPEAQTVEVEYVATPQTQYERLRAAEAALQPTPNSKVTFEPLLVEEAQLWLSLPGGGSNGPYQQRTGVLVDLRNGLRDRLRLTLDEFQQFYAALFNTSLTLLTGDVRLDLDGTNREHIPFEARVTGQSPEALWDKMVSQAVFADYQKMIQVKTFGNVFGKGVRALLVTFQEGDTAELGPSKLEASATVRLPLREFILNTENNGQYHYKVIAIREQGGKIDKTEMPSWKTSTATILYPEVP
jgi:hypothetical protein